MFLLVKGIHGAAALGILYALIDVGSAYTACIVFSFPAATFLDLFPTFLVEERNVASALNILLFPYWSC